MTRGYFGIGIYQWRHDENIGTLWRSALIFGADFIFTIGRPYKHQPSDTVKAPRHLPLYDYPTFERFHELMPRNAPLVAVEQCPDAMTLSEYKHPERAIYVLGSESNGLPDDVLEQCHQRVIVPSEKALCLNVATAGSLVLYDRFVKETP